MLIFIELPNVTSYEVDILNRMCLLIYLFVSGISRSNTFPTIFWANISGRV